MILAKASLNIPGGMSRLGNPLLVDYEKYTGKTIKGETEIVRLEATLQCILGLQNDILGSFSTSESSFYPTNKTPWIRLGER